MRASSEGAYFVERIKPLGSTELLAPVFASK
jgi:hypothetical protein